MPTLEDTIEFQASTLNDLLDADAKAVALPSEGEGKYRSWAYISTAAAGLLAILLVVALVTGNSKGGDNNNSAAATVSKKTYEGSAVTVRVSQIPSDVAPDTFVDVRDRTGALVLSNVPVTKLITDGKGNYAGPSVEVKVPPGVSTEAFDKAFPTGQEKGKVKKTDAAAATPPATKAPEPAPTTTPPASTTPETAPAQTTPPSS